MKPVSIKQKGPGNYKSLPVDPTPEQLYHFTYNRETRRKHTPEQKKKLMAECWNRFKAWKKEQEAAFEKMKQEVENGKAEFYKGRGENVCDSSSQKSENSEQSGT